ncbi:MAG: hypothetical protein A3F10_01880 [Coxiella sp. RIFCSPHIGHO2_12_FULL_42_15]|nr:MAG: hypothetical protein A3F10_01880 [Coxiella sp. RIFCSPHIGHO2_12_FULL_42_15]
MIITEDLGCGQYQITSYDPGNICINNIGYTQNLIIFENELITNWRPQHLEDLNQDDFREILRLRPTIFVLGTGEHFRMPPSSLLHYLQEHHIGVECMHTRAACRTFMVLSAEGRKVAAALLLK